jgi:hypothetical protein
MKKCPTCNKTFEDSMRFCQTDGTPLVDDEPAFDPYATIMAKPGEFAAPPAAEEPAAETAPPEPESAPAESPASITLEPAAEPISEPEDVLDLPASADPLKTMYVSEAEMQAAFGSGSEEAKHEEPPQPEPPIFEVPDLPAPSFGSPSAPPSPFSDPEPIQEEPPPPAPSFGEADTMIHSPSSSTFEEPAPAPPVSPVFEEPAPASPAPWEPQSAPPPAPWEPPPAPDASWKGQEIGSNTPFQPPVAAGGPSQGLAVGSLVCGVLSCLCCLSVLTGPAAVIMGFVAKKKADEDPSQYGGRGMAMGGIITGIVGFLIGIALIILQVFFGVLGSLAR